MRTNDEMILDFIRRDARDLAERSQKAKDAVEYGSAVDVFVTLVMTYFGYERQLTKDVSDIVNRKEVWKEGEHGTF